MNKRLILPLFLLSLATIARAQGEVRSDNIKSIKLYRQGDQTSFPAISTGFSEVLELHFDDLDNRPKNYYYTFQLCNADWTPSMLNSYEYLKGFQNARITNY